MKNQDKYNLAFEYFKKSYSYKMGGTQTVILPNGKSKFFDDIEFYSGRASKYNTSINYDILGEIKVSQKDYSAFLKDLKEREARKKLYKLEQEKKAFRISEAEKKGYYNLIEDEGDFIVELSNEEQETATFDAQRLADTLNISVNDCILLNSSGKTYVFAKRKNGDILKMYHPSTDCNDLNIFIKKVSVEEFKEFSKNWNEGTYAYLLGQTSKKNHFVC